MIMDTNLQRRDAIDELYNALGFLSFVRVYHRLIGLSPSEIARIHKCSRQAVDRTLQKAKRVVESREVFD